MCDKCVCVYFLYHYLLKISLIDRPLPFSQSDSIVKFKLENPDA